MLPLTEAVSPLMSLICVPSADAVAAYTAEESGAVVKIIGTSAAVKSIEAIIFFIVENLRIVKRCDLKVFLRIVEHTIDI